MKSPHAETWKVESSLVIMLILLLIGATALPVAAAPPPPAGFYGYVTSGGANVPDGTIVSAWINGVQYDSTPTFTDAGLSVYTFEVRGDDDATPGVIEGGKEGDPIVFKVGGVIVPQAGVWHSGSNQQIDLTVPAATPSLTTVSPTAGSVSATINVAITGANTHFVQGSTTVSFGAGVTVNNVTVSSATQLSANIT